MSEMMESAESVPISSERLLASILRVYGRVEIPIDELLNDYSGYMVSVDQERDGYVLFQLVRADEEFE